MKIKNYDELINFATTETGKNARKLLLTLYKIAVEAVDPYNIVNNNIIINKVENTLTVQNDKFDIKNRKIWVIGAGKAVGRMAEAIETLLSDWEIEGIVCSPKRMENTIQLKKILTLESTHPFPSQLNIINTKKVLNLIKRIKKEDLVIALISGGGSAIWAAPINPITIDDLSELNLQLINSGMSIHEINSIRKHISLVKGGKMALKINSEIITLVMSDVIGDRLESIASGPFYPDSTSFQFTKDLLKKYGLWRNSLPSSVEKVISEGIAGNVPETLKNNNTAFIRVKHYIIGSNIIARQAAVAYARKIGINAILHSDYISGSARKLGVFLARKYSNLAKEEKEVKLIVLGGESIVKVTGSGIGGRNQEIAASFLKELMKIDKHDNIVFLSAGTDGVDGNSSYAGALVDSFTISKVHEKLLDIEEFQIDNDLTSFFKKINGSLILTGPTGTNVMDILFILINAYKLS